MKSSEALQLIYRHAYLIKNADTYEKRHDLYCLFESISGEYLDLNYKDTMEKSKRLAAA